MEAASLYAYAGACQRDVACVAHVTNTMATQGDDFDKGDKDGTNRILSIAAIARALRYRVPHGPPAGKTIRSLGADISRAISFAIRGKSPAATAAGARMLLSREEPGGYWSSSMPSSAGRQPHKSRKSCSGRSSTRE